MLGDLVGSVTVGSVLVLVIGLVFDAAVCLVCLR